MRTPKCLLGMLIALSGLISACGGPGGRDMPFIAPTSSPLVSLAITPADPFIASGAPLQFTATGTYANGAVQDLTAPSFWTSSDPAILSITTGGLASFVKVGGPVTITATVGGISASIVIPARKVSFVTSAGYNGNLGGLNGADARCVTRATAAGLTGAGNFKAWLSTGAVNAVERFAAGNGPWVRLDGAKVAAGASVLAGGSILTTLSVDESGANRALNVWTGTLASGAVSPGLTCDDWTTAGAGNNATSGRSDSANAFWTNNGFGTCDMNMQLYCFEE